MTNYIKRLASCKLDEPATLKIGGKTATLHQIAQLLKGDVYGEWVNIRGLGHGSDDRSLGIKFLQNAPDGFIVNSLSGDDQVECRKYVNAKLVEFGIQISIRRRTAEQEDGSNSDAVKAQHTKAALQIWSETVQPYGTLAQTYLNSRGITCSIPSSLRFHPNLKHPSGVFLPAMVALVTGGTDGKPVAIHRTFLAPDGKGKAAVPRNKMMLGPCSGGVVQLHEAYNFLMVGEGIETSLSAMQATGTPTWAALSAPGLRSLDLPEYICEVPILADMDDRGEGERAAQHAASRWRREGRRVRIAYPPNGFDFNDILSGRARRDGAA